MNTKTIFIGISILLLLFTGCAGKQGQSTDTGTADQQPGASQQPAADAQVDKEEVVAEVTSGIDDIDSLDTDLDDSELDSLDGELAEIDW